MEHQVPQEEPEIAQPLPDEIRSLLGVDSTNQNAVGPEIHEEIANSWTIVLQKGLDKEVRKELLEKYRTSKNCPLLNAPKLNDEIETCLSDITRKQDKFLQALQNHIGKGLSTIAAPMNKMVTEGDKDNPVLPALADTAKIFADLHHSISLHRRFLIGPTLNNTSKQVIENSPISTYLFGEDLSERIKSSQAVKKMGTSISRASKRLYSQSAGPSTSNYLNYRRYGKKPRLKTTRTTVGPEKEYEGRRNKHRPPPPKYQQQRRRQ